MTFSEEYRIKRNAYARKWYADNRERLLIKSRNVIKTNEQRESHNKSSNKYYQNHKQKCAIANKRWKQQNRKLSIKKPRRILSKEEYNNRNREGERERYLKRKPQIQQYRKENREKINLKYSLMIKKRIEVDPLFKLRLNMSKLIRLCFKRYGYSKKSRSFLIIGCTHEQLKEYFESQFESWMTWDNHGKYNGTIGFGWDIDHIIPISTAKSEEDMIKLNHYTNLRPLDSYVNRYIKRNKVA